MLDLILENAEKCRMGLTCLFVPISSTQGIKLYRYRKQRDFAAKMQHKAWKLGLGPRVFQKVDLKKRIKNKPLSHYGGRFGYITELAQMKPPVIRRSLKRLRKKLENHGFRTRDIHSDNSGRIGRRLVCIDFDIYSMLGCKKARKYMKTKLK